MPGVSKTALSQFVRSGCDRQLAFNIATDDERSGSLAAMPPEQTSRPGVARITTAGREWEDAKTDELVELFGSQRVLRFRPGKHYKEIKDLLKALQDIQPKVTRTTGYWIVQPEFAITTSFLDALDVDPSLGVEDFKKVRPDLLELCPVGTPGPEVRPDGGLRPRDEASDERIPLRVIDIKLAENPGAAYFAEVAYYALALAAWLRSEGLHESFVVIDRAAVWPGSWEAQDAISPRASYGQRSEFLATSLEVAPIDALVPTVRQFLTRAIPRAVDTPWNELEYHVSSACASCRFVGSTWGRKSRSHPNHCVNAAAAAGHLSQVADVTRGARIALRRADVDDLRSLALKDDTDVVYDTHQTLRGRRSLLAERAKVLAEHRPPVIPRLTGTSVDLPKWADLQVHVTAHFDITSAITLAAGISAFAPQLEQRAGEADVPQLRPQVFYTDTKSIDVEWDECLRRLLERLAELTSWAKRVKPDATIQVYLWDDLERRHLSRIVGRHLHRIIADPKLHKEAWRLFPSEEMLTNASDVHPSPVTVVRNVVQARLAADIPHHYTLLRVATTMADRSRIEFPARFFRVPEMCQDPLTDQIPSERAHDIWARPTIPNRGRVVGDVQKTIEVRLRALSEARRAMFDRLNKAGLLVTTAPRVDKKPPSVPNAALSSQLWFMHAKLNAATAEYEAAEIRAMPPHERESKHHSIRLQRELNGRPRTDALSRLLPDAESVANVRVFSVRPGSREAKVKPGDYTFAITMEQDAALLERKLGSFISSGGLTFPASADPRLLARPMRKLLAVTVLALDRQRCEIAIRLDGFWARNGRWPGFVRAAETAGLIDFSKNAVLDPVPMDAYTGKLHDALVAFGNPALAVAAETACGDLKPLVGRKKAPGTTDHDSAGARLLWAPRSLNAATSGRPTSAIEETLRERGLSLNDSQWAAWRAGMDGRLSIVWGPPGTGKTRTLRAVIAGLVQDATDNGRPLRICVGAFTYRAIREVIAGLGSELDELVPQHQTLVAIARSATAEPPADDATYEDIVIGDDDADPLHARLSGNVAGKVQIIGITAQQTQKLVKEAGQKGLAELFDVLILDEASQTDVGHAALYATSLAEGASVVLGGDHLQLPPIHEAETPAGLEAWVGSFIEYLRIVHDIPVTPLLENYRSNQTVVGLAHACGYPLALRAAIPDLAIRLEHASSKPEDWPEHLPWSEAWDTLLSPETPVSCIVYDDQTAASQWNPFEATVAAALTVRLRQRLLAGLAPHATGEERWDDAGFFSTAVGIVTPHRAQMALIAENLIQARSSLAAELDDFDNDWVRSAVDTVERFQGQQRDVIIVSYALGDLDAISDEEEFLLDLNRFNVAASRARAKLIVIVSEQVITHLPSEIEVLRSSRLLKQFATSYCDRSYALPLPSGNGEPIASEVRWTR